jgi:hypothetical protein
MTEGKAPSFVGDGDRVFYVTDKGKSVAIETRPKPPKMSRSKQRYQRYLEWNDCFDSFLDFCRWDALKTHTWNGGNGES